MKVKKKTNLITRSRIIKSIILIIVVALVGSGFYLGFTVYKQIKDFDIKKLTATSYSQLIASDGKSYYTYGGASGKYVKYENIPEVLVDAVIAAEDSRFFIHDGFDLPRIIKAMFTNLFAGKINAGGSTITQQLIKKTYYPAEEKTLQRKIGEVILSTQATRLTSKEKIMELYLNKIYFGRSPNTVGIYAASYYYFNKNPSQLTLPEAALLAGTINSPVYYDPFYDLKKAQKRRNIILSLMHQHGYITEKQKNETQQIPIENTLDSNPLKSTKDYAAYVDRVTEEIKSKTHYDPNKTNMTIYTYMDRTIQTELDNIASGKKYRYSDIDMQAGSVVQENKTGRVVGIMGGRNYGTAANYHNYGTTMRHQPGSSIKPILDYIPAFEHLYYSTGHLVNDNQYTSGSWNPQNWDRRYHGNVSLYDALGHSWNLAAINTYNEVIKKEGVTKIINYMKDLGYTDSALSSPNKFSASYAIGGWIDGATPMQQAAAYATIVNGGKYIEPHTVEKIVINTTGETIYLDQKAQENAKQVYSSSSAFLMRTILTSIVKTYSGSYSLVNSIGDEIGAKTGTSTHGGKKGIPDGAAKDNWFCCFNPTYSWSTWNGYPESIQNSKHKYIRPGQNESRKIAAQIGRLLHSKTKGSYETPDTVYEAKYIKGIYPYVSPRPTTPLSRIGTAWFTKGHGPSGSDQSVKAAKLDDLKSFNATINNQGQLEVKFADYTGSTAYDDLIYKVQIYNGSQLIATKNLTSSSGTISFDAKSNTTYTITGCYAWANDGSTSNKISTSVTTKEIKTELGTATYSAKSKGSSVSSGSTISNDEITFTTSGPKGHKIIFEMSGGATVSKTIDAGNTVSFTQLPKGSNYNVKIIESDGTNTKELGSFTFTVAA